MQLFGLQLLPYLELPIVLVPEISFCMEEEAIPGKKIRRAIQISKINGWSIAGFAGLCAFVVLLFGDVFGFVVGMAIAFGGWMELRGHQLLKLGSAKAIGWLVFSQFYLITVLWIYCVNHIIRFDPSDPWSRFSPEIKKLILTINPDTYLIEELLKISYYATYVSVILVVLIYQGGLSLYYLSLKKYLVAASE